MKQGLRILAVLIVLAGLAFWLGTGANRGWTKNRVEKRTVDEVTGIEGVTFEKRFVPGLDFLGGIMVSAGAVAGVSLLVGRKERLVR
jgi:hypothetical protein